MLLNHWFEMQLIGRIRFQWSIGSQMLPAFGHQNRDTVSKARVSH